MRATEFLAENKQATAKQVLAYINQTHHEPMTAKLTTAVKAHPRWELQQVSLRNLNIPDQDYEDPEQEPESDPYGRVMAVDPDHANEYSTQVIDQHPIVIDDQGYIIDGNHRAWAAAELMNRDSIQAWVPVTQDMAENFADGNSMSTKDMIAYLRQHHDTNLHQDYLDHINTFGKFALKNIPVNTLKTELSGLDRTKVERYKQMDFDKAPPIVMGDGYILDGYHRAVAAKELGIPTIKGYVGVKKVEERYARKLNFDEIYGKYLKVTDNAGDPNKEGFSLVTPLNGDSWNWRERPEFKDIVKRKLNQPGWLGDHKYQQIIDAMSGQQFDPTKHIAKENFADGKVKGKSRPGRVKRAGASCNGSVTDLRARAKRASGEKAKMYHWCANMKSGRKK